MKKKFYFATLMIALLSFTGCANDEYVGDQQNLGEQNGAIAFSTKSENTVRAGESINGDAAEKLHNQFWVYGTKTVGGEDKTVFNDYKVTYSAGTTSLSNTKGWEYVGKGGNDKPQTIKYWDYSASKYDFEAYSFYTTSQGTVARNTTSTEKGLALGDYIVENVNENECANLYFADKMTVNKTSTTTGPKYGDPVTLTFKSVLSKIRVGFYETIPGYSVKIDRFYKPNEGATGFDDGNPVKDNFVAWCPNYILDANNKSFVVSYNGTTPAVTKVKQSHSSDDRYRSITDTSEKGYKLNTTLTLGGNCLNKTIGETYSTVTWDNVLNNDPIYTYVIPQSDDALWNNTEADSKVKSMKIKVDYTLTSTDGSKEEIHVKGATAIVPAEYLRWKPNTAYSYVFRISDRTNGNTGDPSTDPAGLYPITFDAVVEDMAENNNYLTTVSELSITATQDEGQFTGADEVVFEKTKDIKVKVMQYMTDGEVTAADRTSNVGDPTNNNNNDKFEAAFVTSYDYNKSPEQNRGEVAYSTPTEAADTPTYDSDKVVITLPSKATAGFWIVKVTYDDKGKIITKYAVLKVG